MNRTELVEAVAARPVSTRSKQRQPWLRSPESIVAETKAGNKVSIFGFGIFRAPQPSGPDGAQPADAGDGEDRGFEAVAFKPASAFKETLNSRGKAAAAKKAAPAKAPAKKTAAAKKAAPAKKALRPRPPRPPRPPSGDRRL